MIQVGINKIVFIVLGIFLFKISFIDPIINSKPEIDRSPASQTTTRVKVRK